MVNCFLVRMSGTTSIINAGVLTGIFWAFSTTLIVKPIAKVTKDVLVLLLPITRDVGIVVFLQIRP